MYVEEILEIIDLNGFGQGVAKSVSGKTIFVVGGLPGDLVQIDLLIESKRYSTSKIRKLIKASPWRSNLYCIHADYCNGCQIQCVSSEHYSHAKESILRSKFRGFLSPFKDQKIISSPLIHFRNKCTLQWSPQHQLLSYTDEHQPLFAIRECSILEPEIREWISNHHSITSQIKFPARITVKQLPDQGLVLGISSKQPPVSIKIDKPFVAAYWLNFDKSETLGNLRWLVPPIEPLFESIGTLHIPWHPQSFFQTNRWIAQIIFNDISEWIKALQVNIVWDLYCGTGWILHSIKNHITHGYGFELSQYAIQLAKKVPDSEHLTFINADLPRIPRHEYPNSDCWIFNPPRKGIGKKTLKTLFKDHQPPQNLIYMSCNPESLNSDLNQLAELGYSVEKCQAYDMFPWTSHFEVLCLLKKTL